MSHAGTWSDSVCETDCVSICYDEKLYCRLTICSNGAVCGYSPADLRALHTLFLPLSSVSLCEHTEELD
ncbi:hypothetical protein AAFF_G00429500 [Aldrovandia affinis]|uniref:Uncharacterized protein n=1 Tax=Aldrovandia affinis TaxID=143900 RepID=A0AAD7VYG4_9TELE|nr:hypothetical protein AAFF_G00429500 [Aldrovandia affinis]